MRRPDKYIFVQSVVLFVLSFLTLGGGNRPRNLACEMLIAIDEPLYRTIYKENVTKTTEMAEEYIRRINKIYQRYEKTNIRVDIELYIHIQLKCAYPFSLLSYY